MGRVTQYQKILNYLLEFGSITTNEAKEKLNIMQPQGAISKLRSLGYRIESVPIKSYKPFYSCYSKYTFCGRFGDPI